MPKYDTYSQQKAFHSFGSRSSRRLFELLKNCQTLASEIVRASSKAEKTYRLTICQQVNHYGYDLIHCIRAANSLVLDNPDRQKGQTAALEIIERIYDLIPVLRLCRCITPSQEGMIEKELCFVKDSLLRWMKSDEKRKDGSQKQG